MKRFLIPALAAITLAAGIPAIASAAPIPERQANVEHRIAAGVHDGSLTRPEARRLRHEDRAIHSAVVRDRESGRGMNRFEHRRLEHRYNHLSRQIHHQRHDWQRR